ncbi:hypothetical protein ACQP2F_38475 [Actinoplanes sp. CA-030573]|uniref:hypothetical protein n=1 Tax=Actinoplanes sp. CA-030573 TaxID=3239898 RepID=UPI003D8DC1B3
MFVQALASPAHLAGLRTLYLVLAVLALVTALRFMKRAFAPIEAVVQVITAAVIVALAVALAVALIAAALLTTF